MKKNFAAAVMAMTLVTAGSAYAADGTIEFSGKITETACTVVTPKVVVNFGTIASTAFNNVGDVAGSQRFQISVKDCPASVATVRFDAEPDSINTDLYALGAGSTAGGVAIGLFDQAGAAILPGSNTSNYNLTAAVSQDLPFVAKLASTAAAVTSGDILASADFTIVYQ